MRRIAGSVFLATLVFASMFSLCVPSLAQSPKRRPILTQTTISPEAAYPLPPQQAPAQIASADPNGYTPAPMPNSEEVAPVAPQSAQPQWSPSLFRAGRTYRGEGFVPGSSVQASQNRNVHPAPGISLNVPLE